MGVEGGEIIFPPIPTPGGKSRVDLAKLRGKRREKAPSVRKRFG